MPPKGIKTLGFKFEVKSIDDKEGVIEGYASVFNNVDSYGDKVVPGAFTKTIQENRHWPILSNHDTRQQIGINMEAKEDSYGLLVRGKLDIVNIAKAREHFALCSMALALNADCGLSIGYSVVKAEPDPDIPTVFLLKEIRMWEYSLVTFPANTAATVTDAKSLEEPDGLCIAERVKKFVDELRQRGYPEFIIQSALAKFGEPPPPPIEPDTLVHSAMAHGIESLKTVLKRG